MLEKLEPSYIADGNIKLWANLEKKPGNYLNS